MKKKKNRIKEGLKTKSLRHKSTIASKQKQKNQYKDTNLIKEISTQIRPLIKMYNVYREKQKLKKVKDEQKRFKDEEAIRIKEQARRLKKAKRLREERRIKKEEAKRLKAKIFQASTSEVYGDPDIHPQPEDYNGNVNTLGYRSCYDEGKRCSETLFMDYYRERESDIEWFISQPMVVLNSLFLATMHIL